MSPSLKYVACGALIGMGLIFLGMGRVSGRYGDDLGAGIAPMIASFFFLLAVAALWVA
jgi:hypothetical protein